jgi:uncharacterized protein YbbC (DUF1343 family)
MEFLETLKSNPMVLLILPGILLIVAKMVKKEKICSWLDKFEFIGVVIEAFLLRFFPSKSYDKYVEGMVVTLLDCCSYFPLVIKRGILKNNVKKMAKKNMEKTEEFKAFNEALGKLK